MAKANLRKQNGEQVNRSQAIRDMIAQHPKAQSKDIVSLLAGNGIQVRPTLVYYIKAKLKRQRRKQRRQRMVAATQKTGKANPVELILKVKTIASDAGGIHNLKQLVDALAE